MKTFTGKEIYESVSLSQRCGKIRKVKGGKLKIVSIGKNAKELKQEFLLKSEVLKILDDLVIEENNSNHCDDCAEIDADISSAVIRELNELRKRITGEDKILDNPKVNNYVGGVFVRLKDKGEDKK